MNTLAQAMGVAIGGVLITHNMKRYMPGYETLAPDPGTMLVLVSIARFNPLPLIGMVEGFIDSIHFVFSVMMWLPIVSSIIIATFLSGEEHLRRLRGMHLRRL